MARPATLPLQSPPTIVPNSRLAMGAALCTIGVNPASGASPWSAAANDLLAFPFVLEATTTFYKGFAVTGTGTISGNFEIGILDEAFNKIVSSGSISEGSTVSVPVMADFTDVTLPPGLYYAGMSCSVTTTGQWVRWAPTGAIALFMGAGCWKQASVGPGSFPTTATPADLTSLNGIPVFGLITRSVFDV